MTEPTPERRPAQPTRRCSTHAALTIALAALLPPNVVRGRRATPRSVVHMVARGPREYCFAAVLHRTKADLLAALERDTAAERATEYTFTDPYAGVGAAAAASAALRNDQYVIVRARPRAARRLHQRLWAVHHVPIVVTDPVTAAARRARQANLNAHVRELVRR